MNQEFILKLEDRIIIVSDTQDYNFESLKRNSNNTRIWSPKGSKNTLVCSVCDDSSRELIHDFDDTIAEMSNSEGGIQDYKIMGRILKDLNQKSIDADLAKFEEGKLVSSNLPVVIAQDNRAYFINVQGSLRELPGNQYFAYNVEYFLGAFEELSYIEDPLDRLLVSLIQYFKYVNIYMGFPLVVNDTKTLEPRYYSFEDLVELGKKYNFGGNK